MAEHSAVEKALARACELHLEKIKAHEMAVTLLVTGGFLSKDKYDQALDMAQQFLPKDATHDRA